MNQATSLPSKLFFSIITLSTILMLIPVLESTFKEPSNVHIENIQKWRPSWFVKIMHFCSYSGDFDLWWAFAFLYWGISKSKNRTDWVNQFLLCNSTSIFIVHMVKLIFHSGRPYLDKIELADLTLHEYTSAEFGMPSGHSTSSIMNPLIFYYYFTGFEYKLYWD